MEQSAIDSTRLEQFIGQVLSDLAAASSGVVTRIGHRLGFYRAMAESGPVTAAELAQQTGTLERYALEWLNHQRVSGYIEFNTQTGRYHLPAEHAMVLAQEQSPAFLLAAFDVTSSLWHDEDRLVEAWRNGEGVHWRDHHPRLFCGVESFFRKSYESHLIGEWIPSLDGVDPVLRAGASVADVGCGHGASTILMAKAYPASRFAGFDLHEESIRVARQRAKENGVEDRVTFEVASASEYPGTNYDFIAFMDAFHDLGDPIGAARHSGIVLKPGGTLMLVEPFAAATAEENVGPVARMYYAASVGCCVPNAIAQSGSGALGAQAGPAKLTDALEAGGFSRVRIAFESPFNLVLEAKK